MRITNDELETLKSISLTNDVKLRKVKRDYKKNKKKYKLDINDYRKCNYINLSEDVKDDFLTKDKYNKLIRYLNNDSYSKALENKNMFYQLFDKYIGRNYIDLRISSFNEFKKFVENKNSVIAKRIVTCDGEGINRIIVKGNNNLKSTYKYLLKNKQFIIEEELSQANILNKINPYTLNVVRFTTLLKDGRVYIIGSSLITNNGDEDIITSNNIVMDLDEKGNIIGNGVSKDGKVYTKHPRTKVKFAGQVIPNMKRAMKIVSIASRQVPEVRFIGWDIAIEEHKVVLIGCNTKPNYGYHQDYLLGNMTNPGLYHSIKAILGKEIDNIENNK